jgi:hypothetical protein
MNVQNISNVPPHIDNFIQGNLTKLNEIYDEGIKVFGDGFLSFKCKESENKMDVLFLNEEQIISNFPEETWENLKRSRNNKKIFMIEDIDINSMFIVYI